MVLDTPEEWKADYFHCNTFSDFYEYSREVCDHRIMPQEEAVELVKRYQDEDDIEAMNELIICNQKLVLYFVNKLHRSFSNKMWMVCCGNDGLRDAIERYNPEKSAFSTFAGKEIVWSIRSGLEKELMTPVPVPAIRYNQIKKLKSLIHEYAFKDKSLTDRIISEEFGWSSKIVKNVKNDYITYFHEGNRILNPSLVSEDDSKEDTHEFIRIMLKGLAQLPVKYRSALEMFYGINCRRKKLDDIGKKLAEKGHIKPRKDTKLTSLRSRAGQIKDQALDILKEYMFRRTT